MNQNVKKVMQYIFSLFFGQYLLMWIRPSYVTIGITVTDTAESKVTELDIVWECGYHNALATER